MGLSDGEKWQRRNDVDIRTSLDAAKARMARKDDSYRSFDYCFNYFQGARDRGELSSLTRDDRLEVSCMQLGFYLASFGMMRGSTGLYKRSAMALVPVVRTLVQLPDDAWSTDMDGCATDLDGVMRTYQQIKGSFDDFRASSVLTTKIMLGVLGCVPALDARFCKNFHCAYDAAPATVRKTFGEIDRYYESKRKNIDDEKIIFTLRFSTGEQTRRPYPRAKIIDMIFWEASSPNPK